MPALSWLMNLGFAASGVGTRYGVYIDGLTVERSDSGNMVIDAAGYTDDISVLRSGDAGSSVKRSGSVGGGRIHRSGDAEITIEP